MKYVYTLNSENFPIWDLLKLENEDYVCKKNETDITMQDGLYQPKFDIDNQIWIETGKPPQPLTNTGLTPSESDNEEDEYRQAEFNLATMKALKDLGVNVKEVYKNVE